MKIAVQGCCHGDLDAIYGHIAELEKTNGYKIDLLLICGDFQAMRNWSDLTVMAAPDKYKEIKDFHKYYSGARTAPILTIVIGGNHEASNYLWELYHGGWLAPNIYFLGHAGSVIVNGIRISGASGIFKDHDFHLGHHEKLPYDRSSQRSIYHTREYCIRKLSLLPQPDIFISHDWPESIVHYGDVRGLIRRKRHFKADIDAGHLGSPPLKGLLMALQPKWWFAAHLHTRFEATVPHGNPMGNNAEAPAPPVTVDNPEEIVISDEEGVNGLTNEAVKEVPRTNPDEITLSDEEQDVAAALKPPPPPAAVVDIPSPESDVNDSTSSATEPTLSFDPAWLAIIRALHPNLSLSRMQPAFPSETHARALVERELEWVNEHIPKKLVGGWTLRECQNFVQTAPPLASTESGRMEVGTPQPPYYTNPQTEALCKLLEIPNKINPPPRETMLK